MHYYVKNIITKLDKHTQHTHTTHDTHNTYGIQVLFVTN